MSALDFEPIRDEHHIMMALENGARFVDEIERGTRRYRQVAYMSLEKIVGHLRTLVARDVVKAATWRERNEHVGPFIGNAPDDRPMYTLTPDGAAMLARLRGESMHRKLSRSR